MPSRFCIHCVSKSGRPSSSHRTGKGQSSSQYPRRVVPKNVLPNRQLHSSPMLVGLPVLVGPCLKSRMLGFSILWTRNCQVSKLGLKRKRNYRSNCQYSLDYRESKGISEKHLSVSSTTLKLLTVWMMINCGKLLEKWKHQTIFLVSWETCIGWGSNS